MFGVELGDPPWRYDFSQSDNRKTGNFILLTPPLPEGKKSMNTENSLLKDMNSHNLGTNCYLSKK